MNHQQDNQRILLLSYLTNVSLGKWHSPMNHIGTSFAKVFQIETKKCESSHTRLKYIH